MATYNWSDLSNGQSIAFNANADTLVIDDTSFSAADLSISWTSSSTGPSIITFGSKSITLQTTGPKMLTTTNFTFADGSQLLIGDDSTGTANDDLAQTLIGAGGDDRFYGLGGNDSMRGGAGNDTFSMGYATSSFGNDTVNGGADTDTFAYSGNSINGATVNLATHTATNAQGNTTLISIEGVNGTGGDDSFVGGDPAHKTDSLGNRTGERFRGNNGDDTITGGSGTGFFTTADYANNSSAQAVSANLFTGVALDGRGGTDTLVRVDALRGGAGDDLLVGGSLSRAQSGTFFEQYRGNAGDDTLNGGNANSGGQDSSSDRADYSNNTSSQAVNVDLTSGTALDGMGGTDTLIDIEQASGGAGNDTFFGSSGNDNFDGGAGNDTLNGSSGSDTARFDQSTAGVIVNLSGGSITVNAVTVAAGKAKDGMGGTDTLTSMENVRGSDFDDYIRGSDSLTTRQQLAGDAGNDTIDGGAGVDIANYGSVAVVLGGLNAFIANGSGTVNDPYGGTDTLTNVEGLSGTNSDDTLSGGGGGQWFRGNGGSDSINGGAGSDWVFYSNSPSGVNVNLSAGTAIDGWDGLGGLLGLGGTDTLVSIENAEGSDYKDTLTGRASANALNGRDGNDTLRGGAGNDSLTGGLGLDKYDFNTTLNASTNVDTITDYSLVDDLMRLDNDFFTGLATGALAGGKFYKAAGATQGNDLGDRIIYNTTNGRLYFDVDGSNPQASVWFATLSGSPDNLGAADFLIIG